MAPRPIPADIANYPFDLIVIGAGINGVGIARDAALRGLKVLLLEKQDIGCGTSSDSSRLIHGGLRYLEYGEVGLVRESLHERERLLHTAPHLVKPISVLIPLYSWNKRKPWKIRVGMIAYDVFSFDKSLEHHHMLTREQMLKRTPGLDPDGLLGAALYYDGQVDYVERLCLENALSAHNQGALVLTYARVDKLIVEDNAVRGVEFTDLLQGRVHTARALVTVNAAGPWVDQVLDRLNRPVKRMIGGTKGTHLVVDAFPGAPQDFLHYETRSDGRAILIIPWNGKYLLGATDIRYEGDLDHVEADEREIGYLIEETNRVIPDAHLTRDSVLFDFCGVRPLPYKEKGSEGSISRRHIIYDHAPSLQGLISIIGGKLTTYRNLSEQTVNKVFKKLGTKAPKCATVRILLPGATVDFPAFSAWFKKRYTSLPEETAQHLLRVYGKRAIEVVEFAAQDPDLLQPFSPQTGAISAEILMAFEREMAQTLSDVLLRRTMVALDSEVGQGADEAAAKIAQKYLGWDRTRAQQEVAAYREYIARLHPRNLVRVEGPIWSPSSQYNAIP
jgi:glycerol-3-phosphate dehydrogenase